MNLKRNVAIYVILSAIGGVLLTVVALFSETGDITTNDKIVVGGAFIASCVFGISLAWRPGWTRCSWRNVSHADPRNQEATKGINWVGHHPDCENFRGHVIRLGNRNLCAGCTGLALGAILGIILTIPYILLPVNAQVPEEILRDLFFVGLVLVAIGFADIAFSLGGAGLHGDLSSFLVLGFFFVVVGIHQLSGSVAFGLMSILIAFLWLDTRIQLSRWRHVRTCEDCGEPCKAY